MDTELMNLDKRLHHFLDGQGRLTCYPAKYKFKILALYYLASKFEPGRRYAEREVNERLKAWHTFDDWALLRRDLYDNYFMGREKDGSAYWLEEKQPSLEDFKLEL